MSLVSNSVSAKPYPEFPLFPHRNGQWCKKILGKHWFFGVIGDHQAALKRYLAEVDEIRAGRDPRRGRVSQVSSEELTVADLCNLFLERQKKRVEAGEVSKRHFTDILKSCSLMVSHFGKFVRAGMLRASDFKDFRGTFPETWGALKIGNEIQRMRTVFKWGADSELIAAIPNYGPDFKKPSRTIKRREQQQKQSARGGKLDFSAAEIRSLIQASSSWVRACIYLGINGGMGNADCGRLSTTFLDLDSGWYDLARAKTGIPRKFRLWPETVTAIRDAMRTRKIAKDDADDPLCFLTSHGRPILWEITKGDGETYICDNLAKAFAKLCTSCGMDRSGRGFYSLRRTFETVAGDTKDQVAVDYAMGHFDDSMAAVYRQGINDQRLVDVSEHVRKWLHAGDGSSLMDPPG